MSLRQRLQPARSSPPLAETEASAAQALSARRGRATAAPAPKAGKAVAALLRPLLPHGGIGLTELKRRWADIVGPSYASKSAPEKLAGGTLTLRAPAAIAPFLQQQAPLLMERLRLAGANVKAIRIEQRSAAPAAKANLRPLKRPLSEAEEDALAQQLDRVEDAGLKSALMRLGRAVRQG